MVPALSVTSKGRSGRPPTDSGSGIRSPDLNHLFFPEKRGGLGREIEFQSPNQLGACRSDLSTSLKFGVSAATISEIFQVTRSQSAPQCQHTYRKDRSLKAVSDCPRKESVAVTRTGKFVSRSLSAFLPYYRDEPSLKSAGIQ